MSETQLPYVPSRMEKLFQGAACSMERSVTFYVTVFTVPTTDTAFCEPTLTPFIGESRTIER